MKPPGADAPEAGGESMPLPEHLDEVEAAMDALNLEVTLPTLPSQTEDHVLQVSNAYHYFFTVS